MKAEKVILGEDAIYSTDCEETGINNNVLVVGGSGCGKTMSIAEPRLLETLTSSLIVTVTKRRIVNQYKQFFRDKGYVVRDLNFINPGESDIAYDPLQYVTGHKDITFLAESIVMADPKKQRANNDPYWDKAATSLLAAEIAYTLKVNRNPTFADVLKLNDSLVVWERNEKIYSTLHPKFEALEKREPNCFAVSCWRTFSQLPTKTATCIYSTLNTALDTIFTPELRKMIAIQRQVDFRELATRRTILFVSSSAVNPALHCFINMFYAQAFKTLFEFAESMPDGKLPIPVHVLCDDFATGSRILNFPEYISIFREKRISVTLLLQSESQLVSMYGYDDAVTIINNCDTYLYMGSMDLRSSRSASERMNVPLEDVLYMPVGQMYIFRRGQRPMVTRRYNIRNDKLYQFVTSKYGNRSAGNPR
jgi:type IV secretory pathway TraG/TraD family ATPase VirD4